MATPTPPASDISYLEHVPLFAGLPAGALAAIARAARRRRFKPDAFVFRQGDPAGVLYVLTAGRIKLTQLTPEGHQVLLRLAGPGETFGAIALLSEATYPVTAQAAGDCSVLMWTNETLQDLVERFPPLAINALRVMSRRVREFQDRYRELATERVERRVARALLRLARQVGRKVEDGVLLDLTLTRQDLAEMTGTTRYTVSRMLAGWEEDGLIEAGRERVLIKRPHGLVVIAEDLPTGVSPEDPFE